MNEQQPSQGPAGRTEALEGALDRLEADLRKLQIEFERFFNGGLQVPPEDLRERLQERLRTLRGTKGLSSVDRFRLGGLEARFNSYNELFHRRLREREEGRVTGPPSVPADESRPDPRDGILVGERVGAAAAEALYTGLASGGEAPRFDLHSFEQYLQRQADSIREKTHCKRVRFRLEEAGGKMRLKARPIREDEE